MMMVAKMSLVMWQEGLYRRGDEYGQILHLAMGLMQGSFRLQKVVVAAVSAVVAAVVVVAVAVVEAVKVVKEPAEKREDMKEDAYFHSSSCGNLNDKLAPLHWESYEVKGWGRVVVKVKVVLQAAVAYHGGGGGGDGGGVEEEDLAGELGKVPGHQQHHY